MTSDLRQLISGLSDPDAIGSGARSQATPNSPEGVRTMLADLPAETRARLLQRLAVHLPALTDA